MLVQAQNAHSHDNLQECYIRVRLKVRRSDCSQQLFSQFYDFLFTTYSVQYNMTTYTRSSRQVTK